MGKITTKQFQLLSDVNMAWDFMVEAYEAVGDKGTESVEAPFFEYALTSMWMDMTKASLDYELPEGFHFVEPEEIDALKLARCMWKGFNEWELGPFENWTVPNESADWSTYKSYLGVWGNVMAPPPTPLTNTALPLLTKTENMLVLPACGGYRKINWPIWNRYVPYRNTSIVV